MDFVVSLARTILIISPNPPHTVIIPYPPHTHTPPTPTPRPPFEPCLVLTTQKHY